MHDIKASEALDLWEQAGLIDHIKAGQLAQYLDEHAPSRSSGRMVRIVSVFGAVLVGVGMILFVASHWTGMSASLRIATLFLAYAGVVGAAQFSGLRGYDRIAHALWFLATLTVGAYIFLVGQIFNFSLTFWQGPFIWLLATLAMGYALNSRLHAWLAIPLALLALGWFGGGKAWFSDDQLEALFGSYGLKPLLPLLGLALVAVALLVERLPNWRFATGTWIVWGALLISVPLVVATIDDDVLKFLIQIDFTSKQWSIIAFSFGLVGLALWLGRFTSPRSRLLMVLVAGLLFGMLFLGDIERASLMPVYALFVLLVFLLSLGLIWNGVQAGRPALVNIGVGSAASVILIQYFSWSMRLLDRSLAFIIGGVVLIALSIWIEKQRRRLLARITR
ncbi:MAG: DUF2157 domain-containing protein [Gammaproteobacteria bacterium]|nr:DUF2157 domain-containing protein [Gammaproteobacteria bacterium]MCP5416368.1 DUF2157 domain-containing protein [Chromatiaceae bacterium]